MQGEVPEASTDSFDMVPLKAIQYGVFFTSPWNNLARQERDPGFPNAAPTKDPGNQRWRCRPRVDLAEGFLGGAQRLTNTFNRRLYFCRRSIQKPYSPIPKTFLLLLLFLRGVDGSVAVRHRLHEGESPRS